MTMQKDYGFSTKDMRSRFPIIRRKIVKGYKPDKIIVFGSSIRNKKANDIDVMIVKRGVERIRNRATSIRKMLHGEKYPMDILVFSQKEIDERLEEKDCFMQDAYLKGEVIYQK